MDRNYKNLLLIFADIILLALSVILAYMLRFDGAIPAVHREVISQHLLITIVIKITVFYFFKLYNSLWIYASIEEMIQIITAAVVAQGAAVVYLFFIQASVPRSIFIIVGILDVALIGGIRFSYRLLRKYKSEGNLFNKGIQNRVMVVGAGEAGVMVIKELRKHIQLNSLPVVLIDDDRLKIGKNINGIPVLGNRNDIVHIAKSKEIDEIIIAIPSASKREIKEVVNECKKTDCKLKILPGVYEIIDGSVNISQVREVGIEDLLGREEVQLDVTNISQFIRGKTIMVTGAAGSIGSELVRQIIKYQPQKVILFDVNENGLYDLQQEIKRKLAKDHLKIEFIYIIASIRDLNRLDYLFNHYQPNVVFHAAAHKHVPLMENSPHEAVKNNIFGTWNLAIMADKYKVEKFVQISTDKAVNPTNVMGATKRICEMIVQSYDRESNTEFTAVRFGNVLGSNGSVIPLFKKQIALGGPVTVTHAEVIRYFMTIPEASQLVLEAGAMAKGGEIFVLDMGEPIKIIDLAEDLIRLSGFTPYEDIDIVFIGLRPGEKLYEELLLAEEDVSETAHSKIFIGKSIFSDLSHLVHHLEILKGMVNKGEEEDIRQYLKKLVPEYTYNKSEDGKVIHIEDKKLATPS
ncbi:MAG: Polysaccharide biosynthesis protein CapD [Clostridiales bacterium 38_11]|nr:MAG: Polysaccharide biosynthesis protein CapD [Clostridiales bacterium 38_11]